MKKLRISNLMKLATYRYKERNYVIIIAMQSREILMKQNMYYKDIYLNFFRFENLCGFMFLKIY